METDGICEKKQVFKSQMNFNSLFVSSSVITTIMKINSSSFSKHA